VNKRLSLSEGSPQRSKLRGRGWKSRKSLHEGKAGRKAGDGGGWYTLGEENQIKNSSGGGRIGQRVFLREKREATRHSITVRISKDYFQVTGTHAYYQTWI